MLKRLLILVQLAADAVRWCGLVLRSQRSIEAENLFLRRQLALYVERGVDREAICAGQPFFACMPRGSLPVTFSSPLPSPFDSCMYSWSSSIALDA